MKAREQAAADFKALVDARKKIVSLQALISDLEAQIRRKGSREKGKTLADVYKGGTMRREHAETMEVAAIKV